MIDRSRMTVVEIAARGMCRGGGKDCFCDAGTDCMAEEIFGTEAAAAVAALRGAGLITEPAEVSCSIKR